MEIRANPFDRGVQFLQSDRTLREVRPVSWGLWQDENKVALNQKFRFVWIRAKASLSLGEAWNSH